MKAVDDRFRMSASLMGLELSELLQLEGADFVRFQASDVIFAEGVGDATLYLLGEGRVRTGRHDHEGRECLFTILGPGDVLGEESVFDPGPRRSTATAMTDVTAVALSREAVLAVMAANPLAAQRFLRILARRIRWTSSNITDAVFADVTSRVAKHLLGLAQRFGHQEDGALRVPMELTQQQFAHLVGSSRESVNKALCEFAGRGWIKVGARSIVIQESEQLAARMRGERGPGRRTTSARKV